MVQYRTSTLTSSARVLLSFTLTFLSTFPATVHSMYNSAAGSKLKLTIVEVVRYAAVALAPLDLRLHAESLLQRENKNSQMKCAKRIIGCTLSASPVFKFSED